MEEIFTKPLRTPDDLSTRSNSSIQVSYNDAGEIVSVRKLINGKWVETVYAGANLIPGNAIEIKDGEISVSSHVYNPNLNSCAFGKDTVASGQDQFVFGRRNDVDPQKAEIVGSGSGVSRPKYKIESAAIGDYVNEGGNPHWNGIKVGNSLEEALLFNVSDYDYIELPPAYSSINRLAPLGATYIDGTPFTAFGVKPIPEGNVIGVLLEVVDGVNGYSAAPGHYLVSDSTYWVYFDDGRAVEMFAVNGLTTQWKDKDGNTQNIAVYARPTVGADKGQVDNTDGNIFIPSNIRTLDWDGNEYIACSLAIGKDSVAGTEGQLVFGRANVTDTNKAEIVGGGETNSLHIGDEIYSDTNDHYYYAGKSYDDLRLCISEYFGIDIQNVVVIRSDQNQLNDKVLDFFIFEQYGGGNRRYNYTAHATDGYWYTSIGYILCNDYVSFPEEINETSEISIILIQRGASSTWLDNLKDSFCYERSNIRTLDWQGNQWNAGDITCDDGNGNTISMRNLLSRIAALEAGQAQ